MKYDGGRTGAITRKQMSDIIKLLLKEDPQLFNQDELENVINKYSKGITIIIKRIQTLNEFSAFTFKSDYNYLFILYSRVILYSVPEESQPSFRTKTIRIRRGSW